MTTQSTFSIAKALHYIAFSSEYLKVIIADRNVTPASKQRILSYTNKLEWILRDVTTSIPSDSADLLRKEIQQRDIAAIDSVFNLMITMTEEQRSEVEKFCEKIIG